MKVHHTARKHGIDDDDSLRAAQHPVYLSALEDDLPAREGAGASVRR